MHTSAYEDAVRFSHKYLKRGEPLKIADVGSCDVNGNLKPIFACWDYTGFDICEGKNVDVVIPEAAGWGRDAKFENSFDVVLSTQVMEHVRRPWEWIKDLVSICKPGGIVYISTPNTIGYHQHPIDCWRVWPDGMRSLMESAGLEVIEVDWPRDTIDTNGVGRKPDASSAMTRSRAAAGIGFGEFRFVDPTQLDPPRLESYKRATFWAVNYALEGYRPHPDPEINRQIRASLNEFHLGALLELPREDS